MDFIRGLFGQDEATSSLTREQKQEADQLLRELVEIGRREDYLSEIPGGSYDNHCRHRRTREIGKKLEQLGGMPLMWKGYLMVQKKVNKSAAAHLEYAWVEIGSWMS